MRYLRSPRGQGFAGATAGKFWTRSTSVSSGRLPLQTTSSIAVATLQGVAHYPIGARSVRCFGDSAQSSTSAIKGCIYEKGYCYLLPCA